MQSIAVKLIMVVVALTKERKCVYHMVVIEAKLLLNFFVNYRLGLVRYVLLQNTVRNLRQSLALLYVTPFRQRWRHHYEYLRFLRQGFDLIA